MMTKPSARVVELKIDAPLIASHDPDSTIGIDDVTENLCDGCYKGFTGSLDDAIPGWKRVDVLKRQLTAGEEDQSGAFADDW